MILVKRTFVGGPLDGREGEYREGVVATKIPSPQQTGFDTTLICYKLEEDGKFHFDGFSSLSALFTRQSSDGQDRKPGWEKSG